MHIPIKARITMAIIAGIGLGTGSLFYGFGLSSVRALEPTSHDPLVYASIGAALLAASIAGLIAHLLGGFKDVDEER
jgi:hypothetical protein